MPIQFFPCNGPQRIFLPTPRAPWSPAGTPVSTVLSLGNLPSWRVIFPKQDVDIFNPAAPSDAADAEGYFPINAVYLEACPCRPTDCEDAYVFIDDAISRCAVWLNDATVIAAPGTLPVGQIVDFKIRVAAANIGNDVFHGSFGVSASNAPTSSTAHISGLLAHVSGILGTQFEVWMRVRFRGPTTLPVRVRLQMIVDRLGDDPFAFPGKIAGGPDLPLPCCATGATGP